MVTTTPIWKDSAGERVVVTELTPFPVQDINLSLSAFDELLTAQPEPVIQILAVRGLGIKTTVISAGTGTTTVVNGEFVAQTGTDASGFAAIGSKDIIAYRAGQGLRALFTATFTTGVVNSRQSAGLNNSTNGYNFGFIDDKFGISRRFDGVQEIQDLQVTTAATGSENATVTINGVGFTVPLTAGTVQSNAAEISDSLNSQVPNWRFEQQDDTVVAIFNLAAVVAGAFSFSSATAAATFTQISIGVGAAVDFVEQANWNTDTLLSLDPTKGNVYAISTPYLGYGDTLFYIKAADTGRLTQVHRFKYVNQFTRPHVSDPTFGVNVSTFNTGNTSNLTVKSASLSAFNEGKVVITEPARSLDRTVASVSTTEIPIFSLRNRLVTPLSAGNFSEIIIKNISGSTDSSKGVIFRLYRNGTLTDSNFDYVDKDQSIASSDQSATVVTGTSSSPFVAVLGSTASIEPERFNLQSGNTLTITAQLVSGAASDVTVTLVYVEDL